MQEVRLLSHPLSERELLELSERMLAHEVLIEKAGFLATQTQSSELQQMIRRHQQTHVRHYNEMLSFLQQGVPQTASGNSHPVLSRGPVGLGREGIER